MTTRYLLCLSLLVNHVSNICYISIFNMLQIFVIKFYCCPTARQIPILIPNIKSTSITIRLHRKLMFQKFIHANTRPIPSNKTKHKHFIKSILLPLHNTTCNCSTANVVSLQTNSYTLSQFPSQ